MAKSIKDRVKLSNGVEMPWVGLGTWKTAEGKEAAQAVKWALELGYRHIDTAAIYGNERGVGQGVRESGVPREEVFVTTKLWNDDVRQGYDACLRAIDASLERLGMEYVDLYLIHWPVKGKYKDAWRALERIYKEKKARAIGLSNFMVHHLKDVMADAEVMPMVDQVEFHPMLVQKELIEFCKQKGIVQEAWSPIMQGKLGEPVLQEIAKKHGKTPAQVVLRWDLQHGIVTIPKSVNRGRIEENSKLFDFELSDEEMRRIDGLDQGKRLGADPDNFSF